ACPSNSYSTPAGTNTINSCPCLAGFDARQPGQCTQCLANTYRDYASTFNIPRPQAGGQGVESCLSCGEGSSSPVGTAARSGCSIQCAPGSQPIVGGGCELCPAGTWKSDSPEFNATSPCLPCSQGNRTTAVFVSSTEYTVVT